LADVTAGRGRADITALDALSVGRRLRGDEALRTEDRIWTHDAPSAPGRRRALDWPARHCARLRHRRDALSALLRQRADFAEAWHKRAA